MISVPALRRSTITAILFLALGAGPSATATRAADPLPTDDEILKAKCTLCHDGHRIYRIKPDDIRPVLERMRKLNPDWITTTDSDHIAKVIARILEDPNALAERQAWLESVDRGRGLFNDPSLGTTGKSCASCHDPAKFKHADEEFPKYSVELKRFVDIQEWISMMITGKMKGAALPPFDQRYLDLLVYIKSLK